MGCYRNILKSIALLITLSILFTFKNYAQNNTQASYKKSIDVITYTMNIRFMGQITTLQDTLYVRDSFVLEPIIESLTEDTINAKSGIVKNISCQKKINIFQK
jgi:hypothetical protein